MRTSTTSEGSLSWASLHSLHILAIVDSHQQKIECLNVIILTATNVTELDGQWDCLIELTSSSGLLALAEPFVSKRLRTTQSDVETAQPLSKLCLEFPDLYIGCYRESRTGPLVISFEGKLRKHFARSFILGLSMKSIDLRGVKLLVFEP
ncbi:uncharacterized protein LOC114266155 [Camellia sinensis]|uniref:uncharacterized protein LOC114266155 n=1 Tax=Camellia sinensis TaxID=4442 RepID=UPI001036F156|nr:uncharacterized protein LOC114266155 [Camellia sinensis]